MEKRHVLLVTFPVQGHINPALQFAKRLITMGIQVTFSTSVYGGRRMAKFAVPPEGLTFAPFSDGYDDGFKPSADAADADKYMNEVRSHGSRSLKRIILEASDRGCPVTCLVYTLLLPWAAQVAREFHIPSALLWIQPATVLAIYYHYFNGFADAITRASDVDDHDHDPSRSIELPGIPFTLSKRDLPSFMLPGSSDNRYSFMLPAFKEQLEALDACETKPAKVLVNTFDALEFDTLTSIGDKYELIGIGPLIPSDPSDKSFGGDMFRKSDDYMEWLDSNPDSSVVYISFGSLIRLQKPQMEEIGRALLDSARPFLWVIRADDFAKTEDNPTAVELSCLHELEEIGKIVGWCSQLDVLTHRSLGCFVTHCGWNSTLESLSCGVPVVAFPHWTDQGTNAKLIEDVWGSGVRVRGKEDGMVESGEIRRCIEEVMDGGDKSKGVRENARKWKCLAREAMEENGSSKKNLKTFLQEVFE